MVIMNFVTAGSLVVAGLWLIRRNWSTDGRVVSSIARWRSGAPSLQDQRRLVEAIAVWTEGLRDAIAGASGIEQAIITTGTHSPAPIAQQVGRLVASLRYEPLATGLRRFASDIGHPTCDFVVVALLTAAENQTREMAQLLSHLSECARAECDSYLRIWVSRARNRSAVRIISWSVLSFTVGLFVLNRAYVAPFFTPSGSLVLCVMALMFALSISWLRRISRIEPNARLFSHVLRAGER